MQCFVRPSQRTALMLMIERSPEQFVYLFIIFDIVLIHVWGQIRLYSELVNWYFSIFISFKILAYDSEICNYCRYYDYCGNKLQ